MLEGETAFGFVAVTRCERPAAALGRGSSTDLASELSAADLLHSVVVTMVIIIMIIVSACSTDD